MYHIWCCFRKEHHWNVHWIQFLPEPVCFLWFISFTSSGRTAVLILEWGLVAEACWPSEAASCCLWMLSWAELTPRASPRGDCLFCCFLCPQSGEASPAFCISGTLYKHTKKCSDPLGCEEERVALPPEEKKPIKPLLSFYLTFFKPRSTSDTFLSINYCQFQPVLTNFMKFRSLVLTHLSLIRNKNNFQKAVNAGVGRD